tara:strand:+ start:921 stop:1088 length:168 start_codon:yes stop_codon:yes gene_type:complete
MSSFSTRKSNDRKIRANALSNGNEFAKMTFLQLKKDDSTWNRLLRYLRLRKPQKI